jgi:hypothetical protein
LHATKISDIAVKGPSSQATLTAPYFFSFLELKTPIFVMHLINMPQSQKIKVADFDVATYVKGKDDFFSLTDMARYRDADRTNYIIQNWMRTRNAIEFNGLWEQLNNPDFKSIEFDAFKN